MSQVPTIGRRVYYWPSDADRLSMASNNREAPMDAGIVYVWTPTCVNLAVTDHAGVAHSRTSVAFGAPMGEGGSYADWMPYQKGASHTPAPAGQIERQASEHPYPRFGDRSGDASAN